MPTLKQIQNWSQLYGAPISGEKYKGICDNLNGFFSILKKWDNVEKKSIENERTCNIRNSNNSG